MAEIRKIVNVDVEGYAGEIAEENKATYSKPVTVVDNSIKANVTLSLFEDVDYSPKGSAALGTIKNYSLSVSDEWVEMVIAVDITENYATDLALSQKNGKYIPIRPTISLGSGDGWASVLYVDDVTCSIVPTLK